MQSCICVLVLDDLKMVQFHSIDLKMVNIAKTGIMGAFYLHINDTLAKLVFNLHVN